MPMINLIQERRTAVRQRDRKSRAFFLGFVAVACVCGLAFAFLSLESGELNRQESSLRAKLRKLEPIVKEIKANELTVSELAPRLTTLEGAQTATLRWSRILDHLSRNVPAQVWLTNVRCSNADPTKPVQFNVTGVSQNQDLVGEFLLRLQGSSDLGNITLKMTSEKTFGNAKGTEFEIVCDVIGTEEEQPKAKKSEDKKAS